MLRAVVALPAPDLRSHSGARGASLCAEDHIAFRNGAAAVELEVILGAHLE